MTSILDLFKLPTKPSYGATAANSTPATIRPTVPAVPAVPIGNSQSSSTALAPGQFGSPAIPMVRNTIAPAATAKPGPAVPAVPAPAPIYTPPAQGGVTLSDISKTLGDISTGLGTLNPSGTNPPPGPANPDLDAAKKAVADAEASYSGAVPLSADYLQSKEALDNLIASTKAGYTGAQNQPIPLEFITGQLSAIERRSNTLAEPLQQKMARLEANRTATLEASKYALDRADKNLQNLRELNKPVSISYGGALINPQTGAEVAGTVTPESKNLISKAISEGRLDTTLITRYGFPFIADTLTKNPDYDFNAAHTGYARDISTSTQVRFDPVTGQMVTYQTKGAAPTGTNLGVTPGGSPSPLSTNNPSRKAIGDTLTVQQKALSDVRTGINTADANFKFLLDTLGKTGVNDQNSPIINAIQNAVNRKVLGSGALNQFDSGIATLRTEYARVLARGGDVTDNVRKEAETVIPSNISMANLQKVYNYIRQEGQNVLNERQAEIDRLTGNSSGGGSAAGGSADADYQAYLKAIGQQ